MKKIILFLLTLLAFSSLILAEKVFAASCSSFTSSIKGSAVTLTGTNCSPEGRYLVQIIKNEQVLDGLEVLSQNGKVEAVYHASQEGNYGARLVFAAAVVAETSFSIEPANITPLKCGDPCNPNDSNCPSQCPSTYLNGKWSCYQTPTSPPKPTSPTQEEKSVETIDFSALGKAIPGLQSVFQPGPSTNVSSIASLIIPFLFVAAGLLLLFYLIFGGLQMMISAGDEKGLAEARGKITNALIGFLLLFVSFWLVQIVEFVLGIKIF